MLFPVGYLLNIEVRITTTIQSIIPEKDQINRRAEQRRGMEPVGFFGIFEESRRIISAHSRHFLGLSVLFLLPIAFLNCAASTFRKWVDTDGGPEELLSSTARPYDQYHPQESLPFSTGLSGAYKTE